MSNPNIVFSRVGMKAAQIVLAKPSPSSALVGAPTSQPTLITLNTPNLADYANTVQMLANDATTYANAVNFAALAAANAYANAIAFASNAAASVAVADLTDVVLSTAPPANNSTLVYSSANNKYVVKQLDLDGGNF